MKFDLKNLTRIHRRQFDIVIYETRNPFFFVEGRLVDTRYRKSHYMNGTTKPRGTLHHMMIRMQVSLPGLVIEDIEARMKTAPRNECREVEKSLSGIRGTPIAAGFTRKVKNLYGGARGCTHLIALLLAMGTAAVQGAWSISAQHPISPSSFSPRSLKLLENTCHLWRSDGPLVPEYRFRMEENRKEGGEEPSSLQSPQKPRRTKT
jgi:hypothetical protein